MQPDILCFSHLRWDFVYQRPQHLMTRLAAEHRVFFIEEPVFDAFDQDHFTVAKKHSGQIVILTPHLPIGTVETEVVYRQRLLLHDFLLSNSINDYICWYYSPMMLAYSDDLQPACTIYDCMDELSAFLFAPPDLCDFEAALMLKADLVFTGGRSLYIAKKELHRNIHLFPSSIDKRHFVAARKGPDDPADQAPIPWPRIGFYGVIDERLDVQMLQGVAGMRPEWHFVLVGPVVKIDPDVLPHAPNIHYLGSKTYDELPNYLAGWNIAMIPFALNASTRFISPTKTPEYLAGGKPVISPAIADVVCPYGDLGLVQIVDSPASFVDAAELIFSDAFPGDWLKRVDLFLADLSWDKTVREMRELIFSILPKRGFLSSKITSDYV